MANDRQLARREALGVPLRDPWREFSGLAIGSPIGRLMEEFLGEGTAGSGSFVAPLDITETENSYVLTVDLPGVKKEDVSIESRDQAITIRAEKKSQRDSERERAYRMERRHGVFTRTVQLPDDADLERIDASYEDGVLRVVIEKKPETKPRRVEIH